MTTANYINHVVFVLDASASMDRHARSLVKVADAQIQHLAQRSQELDQETRVSVYTFNSRVECLVYDKDVLRLPSISTLYRPGGRTALIDATLKSLDDLRQTATLYGDHAFLTFVLTDGAENASRAMPTTLRVNLEQLEDNWTVGCLVPDQMGVHEAKRFGFPAQNIAVWDASSTGGVTEAGAQIRRATDTFMTNRASGVRGTRSLFSTGDDAVNQRTVSTLTPLTSGSYWIQHADHDLRMDEVTPRLGKGFYQLTKRETIQGHKLIAIREKATGKVYLDEQARSILGLPTGVDARVSPTYNAAYDVFVQSTAPNRKVPRGTDALVLR